jgi:L-lactate utilization protein LutC
MGGFCGFALGFPGFYIGSVCLQNQWLNLTLSSIDQKTSNSVHVTLAILTGMKVNDLSMTPGALINQFTHRPESEIWINQDLVVVVVVVCGLAKEGTVVAFKQDEYLILLNLEQVNRD